MMQLEIEIKNLDEIQQKLKALVGVDAINRALERFANEVKLRAIPYPPEGDWNLPGPYPKRWYQRHFGPRWRRKDGSIGGRDTSERMQKQWIAGLRGNLSALVGNRASYADYVMGEQQAPFHAAHGWRKLDDIAREQNDLFAKLLLEEIL